jgi:MFS family permease
MAINRTQGLVLGFFVLAWASLVALFAAAPEVFGRALGLSSAEARLLFLGAITAFLALLGVGVIRRWRWAFWLILVAFLFGPLRVVASVLALGGVLSATLLHPLVSSSWDYSLFIRHRLFAARLAVPEGRDGSGSFCQPPPFTLCSGKGAQ